jgi:hypothetical protein
MIIGNQQQITVGGQSGIFYCRWVTVTNSGITFSTGYTHTASAGANATIPLEIYGCGASLI